MPQTGGYNIEFNYERNIEQLPILSIGIDLGFGKQNDFPDYFDKSFMFAEGHDVSTKVDEHIRSLSIDEVSDFSFKGYNVNYLRLLAKFRVVSLKGFELRAFSGILIRDENFVDFDIYHISYNEDGSLNYKSNFRVQDNTTLGWPLGLELKKQLSPKLKLSLDALYGIPFDRRTKDLPVNLYSRIGISRVF
ncbi:hypothetical protein FKX85_11190 [Echinicola soli]|uniref:Outer membrane protein beta-barrel domain-containing protein n=1 Tax=Echinicola soli TaxID=2591634 RepID=A0A514CIB7_9BACT|nr:hypothetical protein [Echinicola soli]QDH79571.1 hypothetical protein FKX85_11190 [Echinicola soli]